MPAMWIPLNIWNGGPSDREILVLPAENRRQKDRPVGPRDSDWHKCSGEYVSVDEVGGCICLTRPAARDRDPEAWAAFEAEERRRNEEDRRHD